MSREHSTLWFVQESQFYSETELYFLRFGRFSNNYYVQNHPVLPVTEVTEVGNFISQGGSTASNGHNIIQIKQHETRSP